MSDEYLLEKEGSDPEVERLENLLSVYRLEPTVPKLASPEFSRQRRFNFGWLRLGYAVAFASFTLVLLTGGVYLRYFRPTKIEITAVSPIEMPASNRDFVAPAVIDSASISTSITDVEGPANKQPAPRRIAATVARRRLSNVAPGLVAAKTPKLTKEEQFAYDQLKVALWITGTKLRVVQDTINRVDDQKPDSANDKR